MMNRFSKRFLLGALFMAAFVVTGLNPGAAKTETVKLDDLLMHFEQVVFGAEYEGADKPQIIRKWVGPVRLSVNAMDGQIIQKAGGGRELKLKNVRPTDAQVDLIRKHLTTLVSLTKVKSEKSDKDAGKPANLFIRFVPRLAMGQSFIAKDVEPKLLATLAKPGVCYFVTRAIRSGALFRGLIVVNRELPPDQMDACILEEMAQAFGMPNDSDIVSPSVFNNDSQLTALSASDRLIIRTVYDRRMPAGTPQRDAMRLARDLLIEHAGQ